MTDINWNNYLENAIKDENLNNVKIAFKNGANPNNIIGNTSPPFLSAIEKGNLEIIQQFIDHGVDINLRTDTGYSALFWIDKNADAVLKRLLQAGADINTTDNHDGETPLIAAIHEGKIDVVQAFITNKADIHTKDRKGRTAFTRAVSKDFIDAVQILITAGANINDLITPQYTPVMYALNWDQTEMAKLLINAGADLNFKNNKDRTALSIAQQKRQAEIVRLIETRQKQAAAKKAKIQARESYDNARRVLKKQIAHAPKLKRR